jgi:hypothetical protein
MKNRVAKLTQIRKIDIFEEEIPKLKEGQILVAMKSVGICGSDMHYFKEGGLGSFKNPLPMYMGHEPAGVIVDANGSKKFKDGDRVDYRGQKERVMVGISTSIDINVAKRFGNVIFVLDRDLLEKDFPLYRVNYFTNPDKDEQEVFVAAYITDNKMNNASRLKLTWNNSFKIDIKKYVVDIISK